MRRFAAILSLVLAFHLAYADALSKGSTVELPLRALKPSQMRIGRAEVDATFAPWRDEAAARGMTLTEYARKVLVPKFGRKKLEAIVDPEGNVRPTDGHHRIAALLEVARQTGIEVPVHVTITTDYRRRSMAYFAEDFVQKHGKGAFSRGVLRLAPLERVKHLPDSFGALKNSTMRTAVARLFTRLHLDDEQLVDYAEFKVGDWLVDHGLFGALTKAGLVKPHTTQLPTRLVEDPRALDIMQRALEADDGVHFAASLAPGHERSIENRLANARR